MPLQGDRYVKITVEDQGTGIPEGDIDKIFDPYSTTKGEGKGLGLATTHSIVKAHAGHLTVDSELGVGTTFTIYLPSSEKPVTEDKAAEEETAVGEERVLLMDDDEMVRDIAREMLTSMGYDVECANDGLEALELYTKARESGVPFGVVIMDLTIPGGMGGKEAIEKLRAIDPDIKAIVSSGYSTDPVMADFRGHGFDAVISKPYRLTNMSKVLQNVLKDNSHAPST